jgi:hypothetical protein
LEFPGLRAILWCRRFEIILLEEFIELEQAEIGPEDDYSDFRISRLDSESGSAPWTSVAMGHLSPTSIALSL